MSNTDNVAFDFVDFDFWQCRALVALLSKVDCHWLVRLCRTTVVRQLMNIYEPHPHDNMV